MVCYEPPNDDRLHIAASPILPTPAFIAWRVLMALYLWGLFGWSCALSQINSGVFAKILIYFTVQTLVFCAIYLTLGAAASICYHWSGSPPANKLKTLCKWTENMQILCCPLSVAVVIGFWGFLSQYAKQFGGMALNVQEHGMRTHSEKKINS